MTLSLFQGFGVEIEYMIVDRRTLAVKPVCDRLLAKACGKPESEIERGAMAWSNELALHVVEIKCNGPALALGGLGKAFQTEVETINGLLKPMGAMLMPGGMHPWMDPYKEMALWPHEYSPVYEAYHRIFDCRGHGWANLQSTHLNLPFKGDREFAALHSAIRFILPLLPALAASSPMMDGELNGIRDNRLLVYRSNAKGVPEIAGLVVPEPADSRRRYRRDILDPMYEALADQDPEGVLRHEWLNSRGAIARFDRNAIEIRLLDTQECPRADVDLLQLIQALLMHLMGPAGPGTKALNSVATEDLAVLLWQAAEKGQEAVVGHEAYLELLGWQNGPVDLMELWWNLAERILPADHPAWHSLLVLLNRGSLAKRLQRALGLFPNRAKQRSVYAELCACLEEGRLFEGHTAPEPSASTSMGKWVTSDT